MQIVIIEACSAGILTNENILSSLQGVYGLGVPVNVFVDYIGTSYRLIAQQNVNIY
jgi:hypothetical protein